MAEFLASLPEEEMLSILNQFPPERMANLPTDWEFWSRPDQWPPEGDWRTWLVMAGRGVGKTRTGAETIRLAVDAGYRRVALVAPTAADVRDVMVEGESGRAPINVTAILG